MFEQYSYKKKFFALMVVFVMLAITAYKRSFSNLFQVIKENNKLVKDISQLQQKAGNLEKLEGEVNSLDRIIGRENMRPEEVQQQIVNFATNNGNVSISNLQPIHIADDENYLISTNQIDVTGNVNELLQIGYSFEKNFNLSRLTSLNFYTNKKNNKAELLHLKMIFQNYDNTK